ncbi:MAG: GTP 3',8-cyclase MoaA [Chloroflexi bacterium]|nr:GTP 3',8-cyclase MoaA [Chloroflexota bacterium]
MLIDSFGRSITYLRISLTPRCNLRCVYCMPPEGISEPAPGGLLTNDEILQFVRQAASLGLKRVRLTGGEPLLRRNLVDIVLGIATTPGIEEVSLTTNAMLLSKKAAALADAGLARVNVSLDTLDPNKFKRITRGGWIERVFEGIAAAERAGLAPIKINSVVVRGLNDDELPSLAKLTKGHPWHIRFIELMPVGNAQDWGVGFPAQDHRYISVQEMKNLLSSQNLQPATSPKGNGPSRTFQIPGALGTVGFISPLGEHFCESCNRLRLTADGALRPCLLMDNEISIRESLNNRETLIRKISLATALKPEGHELFEHQYPEARRMAQIGG